MAENRSDLNFGLDADLAAKEAAKFDPQLEAMAKSYLEELSGQTCDGDFLQWLKDGKVLCAAINKVKPGAVKKVNDSTMPFKMMENISNFLAACRSQLGMKEHDLFTTADVYDEKSRVNTINGIINFSRAATKAGFSGPSIAPKESKGGGGKKWDVGAASAGVSKLNMGSAGIMERSKVDTSNSIQHGAESAGTGSGGGVSRLNMGSAGIMERSKVDTSNNIDAGAKAGGTGSSGGVSKLNMGSAGVMDKASIDSTRDINFGAKAGKS